MRNKKVGSDFLEKSRHVHDQAKTVLAGGSRESYISILIKPMQQFIIAIH